MRCIVLKDNLIVLYCLIRLKVKKAKADFVTFCSMVKICIERDNPFVPLPSAIPISVCQKRKSLKLSCQSSILVW